MSPRNVDRGKCICQLSSTKVISVINLIVVGKKSVDNTCDGQRVRPTSLAMQFITLSVHLFVQHDAREVMRRAGTSATAILAVLSANKPPR